MPKITIQLDEEVVTALKALADKHGITMTEALRRVLADGRALADERFLDEPKSESEPGICGLCGKPLPPGEEMFKYHGYSGPCPSHDSASEVEGQR